MEVCQKGSPLGSTDSHEHDNTTYKTTNDIRMLVAVGHCSDKHGLSFELLLFDAMTFGSGWIEVPMHREWNPKG